MTDLVKRLTEGARWIEANARYHFQEHQKHDPLRQSLEAAGAMREAIEALRAASVLAPERSKEEKGALSYFTANVDTWGAAQWFDRLAKAIRDHDAAVVSGDEIEAETCRMIASSSAMRLVRDFEPAVRSALETPSLHKEGEANAAWLQGFEKGQNAAPVPVTITDAAREGWERGRNSWCPAGILADEARTEREWAKELPRILDALSKPTGEPKQ